MRPAPDDSTIFAFGDQFLVECPRCSRQALVLDRGVEAEPRVQLTCAHCGLAKSWVAAECGVGTTTDLRRYVAGQLTVGAAVDWYFHLPLWLRKTCCGETLWAYNAAHLDFIEAYVVATLREHARGGYGWSNQSLRNRLPGWIKRGSNRGEILQCIEALREKL